jgi:hypothetical protein
VATRFEIERAVLASVLDPGCRHLVHVLCVRVDAETNTILAIYQPSLTDLARDTGRHRRTIQRYLNVLERAGWITRKRPLPHLARREHARTAYWLHIPEGSPQARDTTPPRARGTPPRARDTTPPELGTGSPEARGPVPPRSSGSSGSSARAAAVAVVEAIRDRTGQTISDDWAARVAGQILGGRDVRHAEAYLRRVIEGAPPGTYLPTPTPPPAPRAAPRPHISQLLPEETHAQDHDPQQD